MTANWDTWAGDVVCLKCGPFQPIAERLQRGLMTHPHTLEEDFVWVCSCPSCGNDIPIQAAHIPQSIQALVIERIRIRKRANPMEVRV